MYQCWCLVKRGTLKGLFLEVNSIENPFSWESRVYVYVEDDCIALYQKDLEFVDCEKLNTLPVEWKRRNIKDIMEDLKYMPTKNKDYLNTLCYVMEDRTLSGLSATATSTLAEENIADIEVIVPEKVVEVTFGDGQKEKMICDKEDKYDLRQCLFIAIAKHLYKKDYTQEGIEYKANELKYLKKYVKIVDDALKEYREKCESIKKLEENYEKELESIARKRTKREAYKARREQKRKEEQIAIQKEAYIQAMKCMEINRDVVAK